MADLFVGRVQESEGNGNFAPFPSQIRRSFPSTTLAKRECGTVFRFRGDERNHGVIREYVIIRDNSGVGLNYPGESSPLALTSLAHPIITGAWNLYHV